MAREGEGYEKEVIPPSLSRSGRAIKPLTLSTAEDNHT